MSASGGFDVAAVESGLGGTRFAGQVRHVDVVDSTMNLALHAAAAGAPGGVWVADEQTAGRGRGGHGWHSAAGDGLYTSLLVTPRLPLADAHSIPLATGLAVRAAVTETPGLTLDLRWPNDLMVGERKCGGILVESAGTPAGQVERGQALRYAIIGIGLNLNHASFPHELAQVATSLYLAGGRRCEREPILAAILRHVDAELRLLEQQGAGVPARMSIQERFREASSWVDGKRVQVGADEHGNGGYTGWTRGLTGDGFLQVQDDAGAMRVVLSGGVRSA